MFSAFHHQFDRLHLVTNNSRFLILPDWHRPNLASGPRRVNGRPPERRLSSLCRQFGLHKPA
jgi:hypothetical protein